MGKDQIQAWLDESDDNRRLFAQEELIVAVTERISEELDSQKVVRSELAARLGTSKAHITQLLNGSRNMTLRTLADIAYALGRRVSVDLSSEMSGDDWEESNEALLVRRRVQNLPEVDAANQDWTDMGTVSV